MTATQYAQWCEVMNLVARYDWAVEGAPAPEGERLTREEATDIRNRLVKMAREIAP